MIFQQKLEDELNKLPEGWIVIIETRAEESTEVTLESLNILIQRGYRGIVISANRPYQNLIDIYNQSGIDTKKIYVVDCISKAYGVDLEDAENVVYVQNVASLTDLSVSLNKMIGEVDGKRFIFIDSITTMLIHNRPEVFVKFIHSILTKMRIHKISGLLLSLETETDTEIKAEILQLCDKVIKL